MSDRWTWHGGGIRAAQQRLHTGDCRWMDLSTGINPHSWPVPSIAPDWTRLPEEADLAALESVAASHFGADPACVCAVPGTEIGLRMMEGVIPVPAFHLTPSYRTHGEMLSGSRGIARADLAEADGATLTLANPSNPDGHLWKRDALLDLLDRRGRRGWLLVDEAFADTDPAGSVAGDVAEGRRLVVFRSFGKFFGLAGVRLGFVLAPRSVLADLRRKLGAWPLSAAAISIGTQAYADHGWITQMRDRLVTDAAALDTVLKRAGLTPNGASPLFRLIETEDARSLFDRLAASAILTRPFAENARWLRLGLPRDATDLARLEQALCHG